MGSTGGIPSKTLRASSAAMHATASFVLAVPFSSDATACRPSPKAPQRTWWLPSSFTHASRGSLNSVPMVLYPKGTSAPSGLKPLFSTLGSGFATPKPTTRISACGATEHRKRISFALSSACRAWMVRSLPDFRREEPPGAFASSTACGVPGAVVPEPVDILDNLWRDHGKDDEGTIRFKAESTSRRRKLSRRAALPCVRLRERLAAQNDGERRTANGLVLHAVRTSWVDPAARGANEETRRSRRADTHRCFGGGRFFFSLFPNRRFVGIGQTVRRSGYT